MKFKDYLNSLVSKRKNATSSSKSNGKSIHVNNHQESSASTDCHYDICGYDDANSVGVDDQHSRTQILLTRHAELVNTIVGTRCPHDNMVSSSSQYRISRQPSPKIPPPLPPPLPAKLLLEQPISFSNRNYSSTLATCSPRRECQHHPLPPPLPPPPVLLSYHQQNHPPCLISSPYSTPNPSVVSSSNSSLWPPTATASLSKKQRPKIRTNPWIGNTSINNRLSTFIEPSNICHQNIVPKTSPVTQPEYGIYDPTFRLSPSALIHSESFPQTTSNITLDQTNSSSSPSSGPVPPPTTTSTILHQSDSGHGFSLSSSRAIDSSSSPCSSSASSKSPSPSSSESSLADNNSSDDILSNDKQRCRQKKLKKKISTTTTTSPSVTKKRTKTTTIRESDSFPRPKTSGSNSLKRRQKASTTTPKVTVQYRYQRPPTDTKANSLKPSSNQLIDQQRSLSSSSRSIDDRFSLEFEEILENERSCKQRKEKQSCSTKIASSSSLSSRKNPFILPLDGTNIKLPSPPPILFSPTLTKTNSRAILKHIEEIENEIRLIKNLDLANHDDDDDECILSTHPFPDTINLQDENIRDDISNEEVETKDERKLITEQVDQWVEKCLQAPNNTTNPTTCLHDEFNELSNTMKDYVECVCSNDDQQTSSEPKPLESPKTAKLMTAFYLSSVPIRTTKRTFSFINPPVKLEKSQSIKEDLQAIYECPF